jgi:predicted transcriptional regulator
MKKNKPTPAELEVMQVLWAQPGATVRQVHEALLNSKAGSAYTTTLKTLQNMYQKELVSRQEQGRGHAYTAAVEKQDVQQGMLSGLLDKAFGGSMSTMVLQALGQHKPSSAELEEIQQYVNQLVENNRNDGNTK